MNTSIFRLLFFVFVSFAGIGQVNFQNGPELECDPKSRMIRVIGSDEEGIYNYRLKTRGQFDVIIIEKYSKEGLQLIFSREIRLSEDIKASVEEVQYVAGKVFIFFSEYDPALKKLSTTYKTVSASGEVDSVSTEVLTHNCKTVDYDIVTNPGRSKILIKMCYKLLPDDNYKTDFFLYEPAKKEILWKKSIDQKLRNYKFSGFGMHYEKIALVGLYLDDQDNVFYGHMIEGLDTEGNKKYTLNIGVLKTDFVKPRLVELNFGNNLDVTDLGFLKLNDEQLLVAGFVKGYSQKEGEYRLRAGLFSYRINLGTGNLDSRAIEYFNEKLFVSLEYGNSEASNYNYKLDHIFKTNDAIYFVGQQYMEKFTGSTIVYGASINNFEYKYMDILVAKQGFNERIEWIKNLPYRFETNATRQGVYRQYVAAKSPNSICVINNENPKNAELFNESEFQYSKFKSIGSIHGSNLVCTLIDVNEGKTVKRVLLSKNEYYCFAPIKPRVANLSPRTDNEVFATDQNRIYLFTENGKKKYRFISLILD